MKVTERNRHLEDGLEGHEELSALDTGQGLGVLRGVREEVDEARQEVRLGQVEQRVQDVNSRLVQRKELVRIQFVHLRTANSQQVTPVTFLHTILTV